MIAITILIISLLKIDVPNSSRLINANHFDTALSKTKWNKGEQKFIKIKPKRSKNDIQLHIKFHVFISFQKFFKDCDFWKRMGLLNRQKLAETHSRNKTGAEKRKGNLKMISSNPSRRPLE